MVLALPRWTRFPVKGALDALIALVLLVILAPVIVVAWVLVRATSRGPGLYWSRRVGRFGREFWMPKLRTMRVDAPQAPREALANADDLVTPIGHVLRRSGLDELPQLWCIVLGRMSFIGPRPLLSSDPAAAERQNFPHSLLIRPGISGLAQVKGRNTVSPRRKARYDAFYAQRACLVLDALLVGQTLRVLMSRGGGGVL